MECVVGDLSIPGESSVPIQSKLYIDPFNSLLEVKIQTNQCPQVKVAIFGVEIDALLDSGAGIT